MEKIPLNLLLGCDPNSQEAFIFLLKTARERGIPEYQLPDEIDWLKNQYQTTEDLILRKLDEIHRSQELPKLVKCFGQRALFGMENNYSRLRGWTSDYQLPVVQEEVQAAVAETQEVLNTVWLLKNNGFYVKQIIRMLNGANTDIYYARFPPLFAQLHQKDRPLWGVQYWHPCQIAKALLIDIVCGVDIDNPPEDWQSATETGVLLLKHFNF